MALQVGQKCVRECKRVKIHRLKFKPAASSRRCHEAGIKIGVVRNYGAVARKFEEGTHGLGLARCALYIVVGDAGELRYLGRDVHLGIDEGVEAFLYLAAGKYDGAYLGHSVRARVQAGGLDIKGYHLGINGQITFTVHGERAVNIVDEVALNAVNYLDTVFLPCFPHVGERLADTVVGDGDSRMPPVGGTLDYLGRLCERIKGGKPRMYMKLHSFFLGIVGANMLFALHDMPRLDDHVLVVAAVIYNAGYDDVVADIYLVYDRLVVLRTQIA